MVFLQVPAFLRFKNEYSDRKIIILLFEKVDITSPSLIIKIIDPKSIDHKLLKDTKIPSL